MTFPQVGSRGFVSFLSLALVWLVGSTAIAVPVVKAPVVKTLSLRGLQISGKTTITIEGSDLLPEPRIVLPVEIASQRVLPNATNERVAIEVVVHRSVEPGIYQLRLANRSGISNPVAVGVDRLHQQPITSEVELSPIALSGVLTGSNVVELVVRGRKGERLVADVESRRLGAKLRPVVRILDDRGTQLAWGQQRPSMAGDARCELTLPSDGKYTIQLHDAVFKGAAPGHYRLKIGSIHYADLTYPLAVMRGSRTPVEFIYSSVTSTATAHLRSVGTSAPAPWPSVEPITGAAPRLTVSDHAELLEQATSDEQLQSLPAAPVAINGRLLELKEEDRYQLTVKPGSKLRFQAFARRRGSPLDGVLTLRDGDGNQLATNDDQKGTKDPGLDYTVPAGMESLVVAFRELNSKGGPDFVYRLEVTELGRPDFQISLSQSEINIPAGGSALLRVQATRNGYAGPIELSLDGLPGDVKIAGTQVVAGNDIALLTLTGSGKSVLAATGQLVARGGKDANTITRVAKLAETPLSQHQPWLRSELGLATTAPAPISVAWVGGAEQDKLTLGDKYKIEAQVERATDVKGEVRLSLVTNQAQPKKQIPDPKDNKKKITVDDLDRTLRLATTPVIAADKTKTAGQILVPGDLPESEWDLVLKAELLSDDKKTVVATAYSPVRQLETARQLEVELAGAIEIKTTAGGAAIGLFVGKLKRAAGFDAPVTVTLAGLPADHTVPQVVVPTGKSDFVLAVSFPAGTKAGVHKVQLVATGRSHADSPGLVVRSKAVPVQVTVVAP